MDDALKTSLRRTGWRSGLYKGFWHTRRAGIDFHVGSRPGREDAPLELRYAYRTEQTQAEGEVALSPDADLAAIEDAMTSVYFRIHEKPDPRRVLGSTRRSRSTPGVPLKSANPDREGAPRDEYEGQGTLEL